MVARTWTRSPGQISKTRHWLGLFRFAGHSLTWAGRLAGRWPDRIADLDAAHLSRFQCPEWDAGEIPC